MDAAQDLDEFADETITFRTDMTATLVRHMAADSYVVDAARVSTLGELAEVQRLEDDGDHAGLIRFLARERHGSPFEHSVMTFFVQAPIFVFREFQRHRIASYNEESGRYRRMRPVFYVPAPERKLVQIGKAGAYTFEDGTNAQYQQVRMELSSLASDAYIRYRKMLKAGVAREVARMVLPLSLYSAMYVTINARSLMNFLSLRVDSPTAAYPSHPQREIEMVAEQLETAFAQLMPITYAAFVAGGRVAP